MKTSTEIASIAKHIGEEAAVEMVAKAGFDAFDFSMFEMGRYNWTTKSMLKTNHPLQSNDYLAFARKIKKIANDNGIICNQSHAPFPIYCPEILNLQKRAIECTAEAGGAICIIHPDNNKSAEENAEIYMELLPFAKEHGVKIATENMFNWDIEKNCASPAACSDAKSFLEHIKAVNDPFFVACLDIGHAEMKSLNTSATEMIHTLGAHLQALHIHDNDLAHDSHQIPFSMDIDFNAVVNALKAVKYNGFLTLEAVGYCGNATKDNIFSKIQQMSAAAKKLSDMFD